MSVVWTWHGAATPTSVWVRARVSGSSAQLLVSEHDDLSGAATYGPVAPDGADMASITADGLNPSRRYHYRWVVDSTPEPDFDGTFLTLPPDDGSPHSFIIGAAGDAGLPGAGDDSHITDRVSNNPVFDTMRQRSLAENWVQFIHLGDLHYRDIETNSHSAYRDAYDDNLTFNGSEGAAARQGRFFRSTSMAYLWDDHDFGPNNSDRTHVGRAAAAEVYRETVPHYPLPVPGVSDTNAPIAQAWQIGRVLFIGSDVRWARDPNSSPGGPGKTLLGGAQKHWMENVLRSADASALVWIMPDIWMSDVGELRDAGVAFSGSDYSSDSWRMFRHEREELVELLGDHGWLHRMVQITADKHALSISSGPGNPWGHFPIFMFASMDSSFSTNPEGQYDQGQSPGRQRYGTLRVADSGHTIALHGTGYIDNTVWRSYTGYAHVERRLFHVGYGDLAPPFDPTDDDQLTANDVTIQRRDGGARRSERSSGAMSVEDPPTGVGRYSTSETLETFSDDDAGHQAWWRTHLGTTDEARYPAIHLDLTDRIRAGLRHDAAAVDVGDRLTVSDPPPWLPPGDIETVVEGYTETIRADSWEIEYAASPASPLRVARVAPRTHLNSNPHFEANTGGWEPVGADLERAVDHTAAGLGAALQTPDGSPVARTRTRLEGSPRVYAGVEYHFTAWVRSAAGHNVDMSIQWFDHAGDDISFPFILPATPIPAGEWTQVTGSAIAPEGAHHLRWNISQRPDPDPSDLLWIDEAYITNSTGVAPDGPDRAGTEGSTLVEAVGEEDTELLVATTQDEWSGSRWINTAGPTLTHPHAVPMDLRLGHEVVRATSIEPLGWDVMRRSESDTWGTAESGHTWADTEVPDTGIGVVASSQYAFLQLTDNQTTPRIQRLDLGADIGDCEVLWTLRTNVTSAGAAQLPGLVLRHDSDSDYYVAEVRLSPAGNVNLHLRRTLTAIGDIAFATTYNPSSDLDERIFIRTRIIGHRILCRAWRVDGSDVPGLDTAYLEPHHWHLDREIPEAEGRIEAGAIGVVAAVTSGNTNANPSLRFQLLAVETPQRMTVERGIGGAPGGHAAGTAVDLAHPPVPGL